ncbi:MAG: hypothetical protein AAGF12_41505, partial [Myxococcota bacterium]
ALGKIAGGQYPSLRDAFPEAPAALVNAVDKALDVEPARRFATADAFRRALIAAVETEEPVASDEEVGALVQALVADAPPPRSIPRMPKPTPARPRRPRAMPLVAAAAVLLGGAGIAAWATTSEGRGNASSPGEEIRQEIEPPVGQPEDSPAESRAEVERPPTDETDPIAVDPEPGEATSARRSPQAGLRPRRTDRPGRSDREPSADDPPLAANPYGMR